MDTNGAFGESAGNQELNLAHVSADILCEFLEIAVHQILYVRDLYPQGIFERRQKYNIPVQISRHPELNQYITDAVLGIKPHVVKNEVQCVSVVLLSPSSQPLERFVFEITPPAEKKLEGVDDKLQRLERSLRAFVLRLNTCDAMLQKLPPDCTFSILVYTKGSASMEASEKHLLQEFPWVEADDELCQMKEAKMIPLKSVSSDLLKMQLYVEQAPRKIELLT